MKSLFTYIFEFRGGTYTTQVKSEDLNSSLMAWAEKIEQEQDQIEHLGSKTIEEIKNQLKPGSGEEEPIPLTGLVNTWNLTITSKKGFGIVLIVKTEEN